MFNDGRIPPALRRVVAALASLLLTATACANDQDDEWLIRPGDGLGRMHGPMTYAKVRALYPDATLTIEEDFINFTPPVGEY